MYRKNVASQNLPFALINASTGAALTGATVTAWRSIDAGAQASATGSVSELANGQYSLALSQADTNGNHIGILLTATGAIPVHFSLVTTAGDPTDAVRFGLTALPNAAAGATGGLDCTITLGGTASAGAATSITLAGGVATDNYYNHQVVQITGGTGVGQARIIVSYVGSTKVATVSRAWTTNPDNTSVYQVKGLETTPTWQLAAGTLSAAAATTATLAGASATSNIYNGALLVITAGTGQRQARVITAYNGGTLVATVDRAWATTPDSTSVYVVYGADLAATDGLGNLTGTITTVTGNVGGSVLGSVVGNVGGNVVGSVGSVATGGIAAASFAAGAIDAAAIATDAIGSAELAASAVTEIQAAVAAGAVASVTGAVGSVTGNVGGNVTGSVGSIASGGIAAASFAADAITAAAIATDAINSTHIAAGAIGATEIADGAIDAATFATDAITAAAIAANAIGASELATDAVTEIAAAVAAGSIASVTGPITVGTNNDKTGYALTAGERTSVADTLLDRNMGTGTDSGSSSVRTVRQALRALRNRFGIVGTTRSVYKEDDASVDWTSTVTTSASADAITADDPAGP